MLTRLVTLSLICGCAAVATPVAAQLPAAPGALPASLPEPASARRPELPERAERPAASLVAGARTDWRQASRTAAPVAAGTLATACGSVLVLVDGVVAHARMAQIAPPAPGFVYEP